jgi:aromatic ring-cleaving dioxygenase
MASHRLPVCMLERLAVPNFHLDVPSFDLWAFRQQLGRTGANTVTHETAPHVSEPYHAHIYYEPSQRTQADSIRMRLLGLMSSKEMPQLLFVGQLKDGKAGPHPIPQFEIHFTGEALQRICDVIRASGFTALVHPLTDDDLADHTRLAYWIGTPLELDLTTLDPPGRNQGVARFGKSDF